MIKSEPTRNITIWIAGDPSQAKQVCREWTFEVGQCVTVIETEFVYTGGAETGVRVGFVNYPRFPSSIDNLWDDARELGEALQERLCQESFLIVGTNKTEWHSRRGED